MCDSDGWSLTESDPGVFTGVLKELGVMGLEVEELYGLDTDLLQELYPVHALIFLFKWIGHGDPAKVAGVMETPDVPHYFAHQVIQNACASIALLNSTLNIHSPDVELGEELKNLQAFSEGLDPESKGWTISNSEKVRSVHNSFSRSDPFQLDESRPATSDDDAYHFIAYLPIGEKLYELDGLKESPVSHGIIPGGPMNWTDRAKQVIEERIATHPVGEVMFNLMAITSRSTHLRKQKSSLEEQVEQLENKGESSQWETAQLDEVKQRLSTVEAQFREWETDNTLRRHNYIGLIHGLLLELAKRGELKKQIDVAKKAMVAKNSARKTQGGPVEDLMVDE